MLKFLQDYQMYKQLSKETNALKEKIDTEVNNFETAMHVMYFDDPPLEELRYMNRRLHVLSGVYRERVEQLKAYIAMWRVEFDKDK